MAAMGWQRWQKCTLSSPAEMEKGFLASVILSKLHCAAPPGFPNSTADKPLAPTGSPRRSKAGLGLNLYGASWQVHHRGCNCMGPAGSAPSGLVSATSNDGPCALPLRPSSA